MEGLSECKVEEQILVTMWDSRTSQLDSMPKRVHCARGTVLAVRYSNIEKLQLSEELECFSAFFKAFLKQSVKYV